MGNTPFGAGAPHWEAPLNADAVDTCAQTEASQNAHRVPGSAPELLAIQSDLARVFWELRTYLGRGVDELAGMLKTSPAILAALERADIRALPPWSETERVVRTYLGFAGIDPTPVLCGLARLARLSEAAPVPVGPHSCAVSGEDSSSLMLRLRSTNPLLAGWEADGRRHVMIAAEPASQHTTAAATAPALAPALAPATGRLVALSRSRSGRIAVVALPAVLLVASTQTSLMTALVHAWPATTIEPLRSVQDWLVRQVAPRRAGHRWIDVPDPRTRRRDKLPSQQQSG